VIIEYFVNEYSLFLKVLDKELQVSKKALRDSCPCAKCSGETDVFGKVTSFKANVKTYLSYEILRVDSVGNYAIQVFWKDGHKNGIYPINLLRDLNEQN